MAYTQSVQMNAPALSWVSETLHALAARFEAYAAYRTTLNELSSLSGRELADLGLNRSTIRSVAYEAAYGK